MRKALAGGRKELSQILRDKLTLSILLFLPAFFLLLYGYALNWDIRHVRLAVMDREHTSESRQLLSSFVNSTYFDVVATPSSMADVERLMNRGDARAALVIPEGTTRDLRAGRAASVQILVNGDNANTASAVFGYAQAIVRGVSAEFQLALAEDASGGPAVAAPLSVQPRIWYNAELKSTLFLVPGLISFIIMISCVVATSLSIVREKERGTWEQVRMAPIATPSYIVGKAIPYFFISFARVWIRPAMPPKRAPTAGS